MSERTVVEKCFDWLERIGFCLYGIACVFAVLHYLQFVKLNPVFFMIGVANLCCVPSTALSIVGDYKKQRRLQPHDVKFCLEALLTAPVFIFLGFVYRIIVLCKSVGL